MLMAAAFGAALLLALLLTPAATRLAWATGYLDHPEARKLHTTATALLGGGAVFASGLAAWGLLHLGRGGGLSRGGLLVLAGALIALGFGLWDDRFGMRPSVKLAGQAAAGACLLAGTGLPGWGLPVALEWALTLLLLVALMNAINFLDNMNGMIGGIGAVSLAAFGASSAARGATVPAVAQFALAGACAGFLPWNFPRARVFLGDAGSLLLGYSLGASAVLASAAAPPGWARLGPPLMLAYPAFDMIFVVVNRLHEGRKVYVGGKDHSNHRLASVIRCPTRTVLLTWSSTAALCASGLAVLWLNRPLPSLLLWGLWTILLCWSGYRLSSVPVQPPSR